MTPNKHLPLPNLGALETTVVEGIWISALGRTGSSATDTKHTFKYEAEIFYRHLSIDKKTLVLKSKLKALYFNLLVCDLRYLRALNRSMTRNDKYLYSYKGLHKRLSWAYILPGREAELELELLNCLSISSAEKINKALFRTKPQKPIPQRNQSEYHYHYYL